MQDEEALPDDRGAGWWIMTAIQVAAQGGNPSYRLVQRRYGVRWPDGSMHAAIQDLPFDGLEDHLTRQVTVQPCQQRGVEDAPGDDREQGVARTSAGARFQSSSAVHTIAAAQVPAMASAWAPR